MEEDTRMNRHFAVRTALVIALASNLVAGPSMAEVSISIPYEEYELDNGLQVILHEDDTTPIAHVELWYHVGSKDEVKGRGLHEAC